MAYRIANVPDNVADAKRSTKFYFADLYIRVEDTLFKVNRRDFEEGSEVFSHMFQLPKGEQTAEGESAEKPLLLEGITASEMDDFLEAVYPPPFQDTHDISEPHSLVVARWRSVLKLANMWNFDVLIRRSVEHLKVLTSSEPITKLTLYADFGLDAEEWFVPPLASLVMMPRELTIEEGERLGMATTMKVCTLRGEYHGVQGFAQPPDRVYRKIRDLWGITQPPLAPARLVRRPHPIIIH